MSKSGAELENRWKLAAGVPVEVVRIKQSKKARSIYPEKPSGGICRDGTAQVIVVL